MFALGQAAVLIIATQTPTSFVLHADSANTANIKLASTDFSASNEFDELGAGQDLTFTNFVGMIYAFAVSGTQNLRIPFRQDNIVSFALRGNP